MRQILITTLLLSTIITTAQAEVYKCPNGKGGYTFQDMPCTTAGGQELTMPTGPGSPIPPSLPRAAPPAEMPPAVAAPTAAPASVPAPTASNPVSTTQLSLIKIGMSTAEVETRLGKPESVTQIGNALVSREQWLYPAGNGVKATMIVFTSGRVTLRDREGNVARQEIGDAIFRQR